MKKSTQTGFSIIELIIVIVVIVILATIALVSFSGSRKYAADDQARRIIDVFDEARQKALNQRKTFRVEINRTRNRIRLIDEKDATTATDDLEIKNYPLSPQSVIGAMPGNVTAGPTATSPIPVGTYNTSSYPLSPGEEKITLRFRRNGQVVDSGTDNIGTGSVSNGMTLYVYSVMPAGTNPDVIRAVTVLGTSGDTSFFRCQFNTSGICGSWSR